MARDYKGESQKAEKQGSGIGGGPAGSSGGYSGRPGGGQNPPNNKRPSSVPRPGTRPQDQQERVGSNGTQNRNAGSGMLLAGLAYLLLGKRSDGRRAGGLSNIIRIAVIVFIALTLFRSCSGSTYDAGLNSYNQNTSDAAAYAAADGCAYLGPHRRANPAACSGSLFHRRQQLLGQLCQQQLFLRE